MEGPTRLDKCKIALYSHDTMGIGHMRRNLLIAQALAGCTGAPDSPDPAASPVPNPTILLIAGAREAALFAPPHAVDYLTLPSLHKSADGLYASRSLDVSLRELTRLRGNLVRAAVEAFEPDLLIVDKVPRGAVRELDPTLELLRNRRGRTRCVLGLRDVLDDADTVRTEWQLDANEQAVREHYDAVWVYGSRSVYDVAAEYGWSDEVAAKIRYTGYLNRPAPAQCPAGEDDEAADPLAALNLPANRRLMLCMVGGGQDGAQVAQTFSEAFVGQSTAPRDAVGVVVAGPFMPSDARRRLQRTAAGNPSLRVLEFVARPDLLIRRADRVVCMGGYNTVCEVLAAAKPALVVPRVRPRQEQLIRARSLEALGLLDVLPPDTLSPAAVAAWLARDLQPPQVQGRVDFDGLSRLPDLVRQALQGDAAAAHANRGALPPGPPPPTLTVSPDIRRLGAVKGPLPHAV